MNSVENKNDDRMLSRLFFGMLPVQILIFAMVPKMQETLDYCRKVVSERTQFIIRQKRVILRKD